MDVALLQQLGAAQAQPMVLTQVVPSTTQANVMAVRRFRDLHAKLFDDAPSPSGLAGYLAGRYALHLLQRPGAASSRSALLDELRRRTDVDLDGYALRFGAGRNRAGPNVSHALLSKDGRVAG